MILRPSGYLLNAQANSQGTMPRAAGQAVGRRCNLPGTRRALAAGMDRFQLVKINAEATPIRLRVPDRPLITGIERHRPAPLPPMVELNLVPTRIAATVERSTRYILKIDTEQGEMSATPDQPFARIEFGRVRWIRADGLRTGDVLARVGEPLSTTTVLAVVPQEDTVNHKVFDLVISGVHAYAVGIANALVVDLGSTEG